MRKKNENKHKVWPIKNTARSEKEFVVCKEAIKYEKIHEWVVIWIFIK